MAFPLGSWGAMEGFFFGRGGRGSDCGWLLRGEQTVGTTVEAGRADIQVREESRLNWGARGGGGEK